MIRIPIPATESSRQIDRTRRPDSSRSLVAGSISGESHPAGGVS